QWHAGDTLKNVLFRLTYPDGTTEPVAVAVPGDREVDPKRMEAAFYPATFTPFADEDFAAHTALAKGYIGPGSLGEDKPAGIRYLLDPRVVEGTRWVTGADETGKHVLDLVAGRDFTGDGTLEVAEVWPGDPCPNGDGVLQTARGIEMGHVFALGRKYAEALDLRVLDENGKSVVVTMGSYGIGITRAVAAIAEGNHDDKGLIWPMNVAPAHVHVMAAGKGEEIFATAERLARELEAAGVEVLYDDRAKVSAGVKFAAAGRIGVPLGLVVGRGLADGVVEGRNRRTGEREEIAPDLAVARIRELVDDGLETA